MSTEFTLDVNFSLILTNYAISRNIVLNFQLFSFIQHHFINDLFLISFEIFIPLHGIISFQNYNRIKYFKLLHRQF